MTRAVLALLIVSAMSTSVMERARAQSPAAPTPAKPCPTDERNLISGIECGFRGARHESGGGAARQRSQHGDGPVGKFLRKWQAVENNALAIAEVANLLTLPGRKCSNGLDVPVKNPDWAKFVQEIRDAGMTAYAAAQTKNQDKMTDAAGVMTTACQNCHVRYREKKLADRCK